MTELRLFNTPTGIELPAILNRPPDADTLFVFGHGSGSTFNIPLLAALSEALGRFRIASFRFEYPYSADPDFIEFSDMPIDDDAVLIATMSAALEFCLQSYPELTALVGGHSMSGFIATCADAETPLPAAGLVALAFPRKGDPARSRHLQNMSTPLLLVQGTKDTLGTRVEIEEMARPLGDRVTLKWLENATHAFGVEGREMDEVANEVAQAIRQFADQI